MIYVNAKILLIDFKVYEDKEYTFYLDEQLCKLELQKADTADTVEYEYVLTVGEYTVKAGESPEKQTDFVNIYKAVGLILGSASVFALGMYFLISFQNKKQYSMLDGAGKVVPAVLFVGKKDDQDYHLRYEYVAMGEHIKKRTVISRQAFERLSKQQMEEVKRMIAEMREKL